MDRNNKPTVNLETSRMEVDHNDSYDYTRLSSLELDAKLNSFRTLCSGNKINTSNAFDIDMIGHFKLWLKRNGKTANDDAKLFQAIGDFLEATGKIYSCRIDNLGETTEKLVEQFRVVNYKEQILKKDDENEPIKMLKPKVQRSRLMITTSEKLNRQPTVTSNSVTSNKIQGNFKINFNKLFTTSSRPHKHLLSLYSNTSLGEELNKCVINIRENDNTNVYFKNDVQMKMTKKVLCPEFSNFVADHDKLVDPEEPQLDGIEHRFDPNNHTFMNLKPDPVNDTKICDESGSNDVPQVHELLECIDGVNRNYSYFNPSQLAHWKGPKLWKTQAMVKALKSSSPRENSILSNDIDEILEETILECKPKKKRKNRNEFKIKWLVFAEIDTYLSLNIVSQEKLSSVTLKKWNTLENICDTKSIIVDLTHQLSFLEYVKVQPDWWIQDKKLNIINQSPEKLVNNLIEHGVSMVVESVENVKDIDDFQETYEDQIMPDNMSMDIDIKIDTLKIDNHNHSDKFNQTDIEEDDDMLSNFRTETKMDIDELKKEIYAIVLQECVIIDYESEWSSQLPLLTLLIKLRVTERDELNIAIIFVALLHLSNEHGLKLFQEPSTINNVKEIYIARPINNMIY